MTLPHGARACWRCRGTLGAHPATGRSVHAGLGRFGPYIVHDQGKDGKEYRSIKGEDDVLTISCRARSSCSRSRSRPVAAAPRRRRCGCVGSHPDDKQPIGLYEGQYGPYVKHGDVSASLPRGSDPAALHAAGGDRVARRPKRAAGPPRGQARPPRPAKKAAAT